MSTCKLYISVHSIVPGDFWRILEIKKEYPVKEDSGYSLDYDHHLD